MKPTITNDLSSKKKIIEITTMSREETVTVAALLGNLLQSGDILCLDGDLGAGKTAFTSGIAKGLGIQGVIASPTFTILMEHTKHNPEHFVKLPLYHFDAYRLEDEDDFFNLGFDEYFLFGGVCVIEWAERIRPVVPDSAVWITMRQGSNDISDQRFLSLAFPWNDERAEMLYKKLLES